MALMLTLRHWLAESVKRIGRGPDLTNLVFASTLFRLRCELRRLYPTSYYRNWLVLWEAVQLKTLPLGQKSCFPGVCDPASSLEEIDRAFTPARANRARQISSIRQSVGRPDSSEFERSWTHLSCWAQQEVA